MGDQVEDTPTDELARKADFRSRVNEKLLKALMALLVVKDEHLLDELCIVFDHARRKGGEVGAASPDVWAGVNKQIGVLTELAEGEDEDQIEREARSH